MPISGDYAVGNFIVSEVLAIHCCIALKNSLKYDCRRLLTEVYACFLRFSLSAWLIPLSDKTSGKSPNFPRDRRPSDVFN